MKKCDIFRGVKTYSDPIFSGGEDPNPMIYAHVLEFYLGQLKHSIAAKALIGGQCLYGADQT